MEDSDVLPGFDANAQAAEMFLDKAYGTKVDGVIAIDYVAVQALVELLGPVEVVDYGIEVSGANFERQVVQRSINRDPTHKDILGAVATPLVDKMRTVGPQQLPVLVGTLGTEVTGRHLQLYFNDPSVQAQLDRLGWSPFMNPSQAPDYMYEVEDNMGGQKSNYYLTRSFDLTLTRTPAGIHHVLTVRIDNSHSPSRPQDNVSYRAYVQLYTLTDAADASLRSAPGEDHPIFPPDYSNDTVPAGFALSDGWLFKDALGVYVMVWTWDSPWQGSAADPQTIYWQKQPGTSADAIKVTWLVDGKRFQASGTLSGDKVIHLSNSGVNLGHGQVSTVTFGGFGF